MQIQVVHIHEKFEVAVALPALRIPPGVPGVGDWGTLLVTAAPEISPLMISCIEDSSASTRPDIWLTFGLRDRNLDEFGRINEYMRE